MAGFVVTSLWVEGGKMEMHGPSDFCKQMALTQLRKFWVAPILGGAVAGVTDS
jgi:hypothetical protein